MKDKVKITLEFERNENGAIGRSHSIEGTGFHYFELIGLMQIACYEFAEQSKITASELPEGPTKIVFSSGNPKSNPL
jgi:hypothetical protein